MGEKTLVWQAAPPHAWRRYFARSLDIYLYGFPILILLSAAMPKFLGMEYATNSQAAFLTTIVTCFVIIIVAMVPNALTIGLTGSSPGKFIFGIRVHKADGTRLGFRSALRREIAVWLYGMGAGIPFVSLFTNVQSFAELRKTGNTRWDKNLNFAVRYRPSGLRQTLLTIVGAILLIAFGYAQALLQN